MPGVSVTAKGSAAGTQTRLMVLIEYRSALLQPFLCFHLLAMRRRKYLLVENHL
jgi:hypothetical protein